MLPVVSLALATAPALPHDTLVLGLHPPERMAVLDVATGAMAQRRLPGGTLCRGPLMTSGTRLFRARATEQYLRSARPQAFWAVRPGAVREVSGGGRTLFRSRRRPPAGYPSGAVADGIVFERRGGNRVWNPRTGAVRPAGGEWLVAASGRRSAWCDGRCRRLRVGRAGAAAPGGSTFAAGDGRFSPDGSRVAVALSGAGTRIALVSSRTGALELLPVQATARGALAWSSSGDWLYVATAGRRIVAYAPASGRTVAVPVRLAGEVIDLAVAG